MPVPFTRTLTVLGLSSLTLSLAGCFHDDDDDDDDNVNRLPAFVISDVAKTFYDGSANDLLTAGLGAAGLASGTAPAYDDPANPTVEEIRRNTIYNNYRALVDTTEGAGYGRLYGPTVLPSTGTLPMPATGMIPGWEYLALTSEQDGERVTVMAQIPEHFDPENPCIVTATSSGSRGVYGAIGTSGEWGLKQGCAVAYSDKGTGIGFHYLQDNTVNRLRGPRQGADQPLSNFTAPIDEATRMAINDATPFRFAVEQAHSELNAEAHWGRYVLESVHFTLWAINDRYGEEDDDGERMRTFTPDNTLVIGSSVSNGGGAALRAAEQDEEGLIDGIAVSEPNVQPIPGASFSIQQGDGALIGPDNHSRSLLDLHTLLAVYQPCANLTPANAAAPLNLIPPANGEAYCASLQEKGLLSATTVEAQAQEAQAIINDAAIQPEQNILAPVHAFAHVPQSISALYTRQYGRFGVDETLCGFSYAQVDENGFPKAVDPAVAAGLYAAANGIPPTAGIGLVWDLAADAPRDYRQAVSPSTGRADMSLDGILCLRDRLSNAAVQEGIAAVRASGDLRGKPALIVTGRADAVLPINHFSRPYYGRHVLAEGEDGGLRYYEVTNTHHLDAFNAFPGFPENYLSLHFYFNMALDRVYDHLKNGAPLPPSQVVHTTPRGDGAPPAQAGTNLPAIAQNPSDDDRITFDGMVLHIPE